MLIDTMHEQMGCEALQNQVMVTKLRAYIWMWERRTSIGRVEQGSKESDLYVPLQLGTCEEAGNCTVAALCIACCCTRAYSLSST